MKHRIAQWAFVFLLLASRPALAQTATFEWARLLPEKAFQQALEMAGADSAADEAFIPSNNNSQD